MCSVISLAIIILIEATVFRLLKWASWKVAFLHGFIINLVTSLIGTAIVIFVGKERFAYDIPLPNGESDKQMVERVRRFYNDVLLPRLEKGETVLVASHSGIMIALEIAAGCQCAASRTMSVVVCEISVLAPPITPANAIGPESSVTTRSSG